MTPYSPFPMHVQNFFNQRTIRILDSVGAEIIPLKTSDNIIDTVLSQHSKEISVLSSGKQSSEGEKVVTPRNSLSEVRKLRKHETVHNLMLAKRNEHLDLPEKVTPTVSLSQLRAVLRESPEVKSVALRKPKLRFSIPKFVLPKSPTRRIIRKRPAVHKRAQSDFQVSVQSPLEKEALPLKTEWRQRLRDRLLQPVLPPSREVSAPSSPVKVEMETLGRYRYIQTGDKQWRVREVYV